MNAAIPKPLPDDAPHILVVDDDRRLRELLTRYLSDNGFRVSAARDTQDARAALSAMQFDGLIVDVMMPGENGFDFAKHIRQSSDVPIMMLTARSDADNRVMGLEIGVDDYLGKPFEPKELLLRICAMLRRANQAPPPVGPTTGPVQLGALLFDPGRGELRGSSGIIRLTAGEAALLGALASRPNETLTREDIARTLDMDEAGERAIDVQVTRLRRKIEADPREPRFLHTIRGRGYTLKPGL